MSKPHEPTGHADCFPVVELRQYTLQPGQRDALITLFDREFIETQESIGMQVLGQFCDLDDADRFVWLRGFASMPARAQALATFYGGAVWQAHRAAANATMIDSDNVLLLRPALPNQAQPVEAWQRGGRLAGTRPDGALLVVVHALTAAPDSAFVAAFAQSAARTLARHGGTLAGCYITESSANTFPRLPVREGEQVLVWLARFDTFAACSVLAAELKAQPMPLAATGTGAVTRLGLPAQVLRLAPTAGSRF
jgi:NIPSNAP